MINHQRSVYAARQSKLMATLSKAAVSHLYNSAGPYVISHKELESSVRNKVYMVL